MVVKLSLVVQGLANNR